MNSLLQLDEQPENVLKDVFKKTGTAVVQLDTIDDYCARNRVKQIDILKSDTQGYDLNVLKGAAKMLKQHQIKTIVLEVNFIPMYKGQPSFQELHEYLSSMEYRLVDFYNQEQPNGYTAWCDACYVVADIAAESPGIRQ